MRNNAKYNYNKNANPLLRNIPDLDSEFPNKLNSDTRGFFTEQYEVKINLESVHYTGKDYGYGWTFVTSIMNRHWISNRIQIRRGSKSAVEKTVYQNTLTTSFHNLQHMPITICAQHISGFHIETSLQLQPNSFKKVTTPTSIFTEIDAQDSSFKFHELHTVRQDDIQLMFVLDIEITPKETSHYKN